MTAILSSIRSLTEEWRRPKFRPQCTHMTMSRVYGTDLICDHCRRPGQFGWIYHCSQDREDVIDYALAQGYPSTFDTLGDHFVSHLGVRKRSRAARESSLSFFDEITSQQMTTYRPDQVATILKQRENVHAVIAAEEAHKNLIAAGRGIAPAKQHSSHAGGKEDWMDGLDSECQYQICSECRPGASDRTFQSLNAVANGEILPCTATGYGFHILGRRPIADARVVRNIGHHERAAISAKHETHSSLHTAYHGSLENPYGHAVSMRYIDTWEEVKEEEDPTVALLPPPLDGPSTRLKHSPRYENLSVFSEHSEVPDEIDVADPWTPPPSPRLVRIGHSLDIEEEQPCTPGQQTHNDASMTKRMLQNLDRIYALLEDRQVLLPVSLDSPMDVAVREESVEPGV